METTRRPVRHASGKRSYSAARAVISIATLANCGNDFSNNYWATARIFYSREWHNNRGLTTLLAPARGDSNNHLFGCLLLSGGNSKSCSLITSSVNLLKTLASTLSSRGSAAHTPLPACWTVIPSSSPITSATGF